MFSQNDFSFKQGSCLIVTLLFSTLFSIHVHAGELPAYINFNADIHGSPPATGGIDQPSGLQSPSGTSVLVQAAANGLETQPVVVSVDTANLWAGIRYAFEPITDGILRYEATVSFDRYASGFFAQTITSTNKVVTRLQLLHSGVIRSSDPSLTVVGNYIPGRPFRFRMDIDMTQASYAMTVDVDMDGFEDDPVFKNIPFANDPAVLENLAMVQAIAHNFGSVPDNTAPFSAAFDDISVLQPTEEPPHPGPATVYKSDACDLILVIGQPGEYFSTFVDYNFGHLIAPVGESSQATTTNSRNGNINYTCTGQLAFGTQIEGIQPFIPQPAYGRLVSFDEMCEAWNDVAPGTCQSGGTIRLNAKNTGRTCDGSGLSTARWQQVITRSGRATLSCHFKTP